MRNQQFNPNVKLAVRFFKELLNVESATFLYVVWGALLLIARLILFFRHRVLLANSTESVLNYVDFAFVAIGVIATIYYLYSNKSKLNQLKFKTSRKAWIAGFVLYNLMVILLKSKLNSVDFELLHPIQMAIIGLVLVVVGSIHNHIWIQVGGVLFWIGAVVAIAFTIEDQFLIEAIVAAVALILPAKIIVLAKIKHEQKP